MIMVVLCDYVSALVLRAECYVGKQNFAARGVANISRRIEKSEEVNAKYHDQRVL